MTSSGPGPSDDPIVVGLVVLFAGTLVPAYLLADPVVWVLWAASMVVIVGSALIALNR